MSRFNLDVIRDIIMPSMGSIIQKNQSLEGYIEGAKISLPQSVDVTEISSAITAIKDIGTSLLKSKTLISNKFSEIESIENNSNRKIEDLLKKSGLTVGVLGGALADWEKTKAFIGAAYNYVSITSLCNSLDVVRLGVDAGLECVGWAEIVVKGIGYMPSIVRSARFASGKDIANRIITGECDWKNTNAVGDTAVPVWSFTLRNAIDRNLLKYYGKLIDPDSELAAHYTHCTDDDCIHVGSMLYDKEPINESNWEPTNYSISTPLAFERDLARGLESGNWDFANTKAQWIPSYSFLYESSKNENDTNNFETNNKQHIVYEKFY